MMRSQPIGIKPHKIVTPKPEDDTRWLALVIRRGLLVIVRAIEEKYEVEEKKRVA